MCGYGAGLSVCGVGLLFRGGSVDLGVVPGNQP